VLNLRRINRVIYRIKCGDSDSVYIGQTERKLKTRIREHRAALQSTNEKVSAFAAHCSQNQRDYDKSSVKLIHDCDKGRSMNQLEGTEIISRK